MRFSLDRVITLTVLTCAVLLAAGCKEKTPEFFQAPQGLAPATIQGTVTLDGEPIGEPVTVTLSGPAGTVTTQTQGGSYSFTGLPPGDYTITIEPPAGVVCDETTLLAEDVGTGESRTVDLGCDSVGAIQGTILCDGGPFPGEVPVTITGPATRMTTATDGTFAVDDLPTGDYTVTIEPPDHLDCEETSQPAEVVRGQTTAVVFECTRRTPVREDVIGKAVIDYADAPAGEDNVPPEGDDNTCGIGEEGFRTAAQLEAGETETEIVWNFQALFPDEPEEVNIRGPLEAGEHSGMSGTVTLESGIEAMEEYMVTFSFAKDGTVVFEGVSWVTFTDPSTGASCVIHRAISGEIVEDGALTGSFAAPGPRR